jgi:hypothetical protein
MVVVSLCVCAVHHYNLANFSPPRSGDSLSDGLFLSSSGDCAAVDEGKPHSDGVGYSFTLKQQREKERNKILMLLLTRLEA